MSNKHFYIDYEEEHDRFTARVERDGKWARSESDLSLQRLLEACARRKLVFDGMTDSAIREVYRWHTIDRVALEVTETRYLALGGAGRPSKDGPNKPFGFQTSANS